MLFFILAGCGKPGPTTSIFCAASLTGVVKELWGESVDSLSLHAGGSHALVSQYLGGARADLLLLADASLVDRIPTQQVTESAVFAGNRLVLVSAGNRPANLSLLAEPSTVLVLADPKSAPLGVYSEQALNQSQIAAKRVYMKDATAVLVALDLGHADMAVVYASDLRNWPQMSVVPGFEFGEHQPIRYTAVLLQGASLQAEQFFRTLTSEPGQAAIEAAGFIPVSKR